VRSGPRALVFLLALVCTVLVVVGSLATWAKVPDQGSFSGTDANAGKTTLVGAIVVLAFLALATWKLWRWAAIIAAIPAAIVATIAAYRLADIEHFVEGFDNATAGWGVWVATIAAIALFVLCLVHALLPKVVGPAIPPVAPQPPPEQPAAT
jgi:hypothetical protein